MRVKYLAGIFRRDFFQFGGLPTGGRSEQAGGRTGAAQAVRRRITGGDGGRPPPAPAERAAAEDGYRGGTGCRTAATACRIAAPKGFMRKVSSLYTVY